MQEKVYSKQESKGDEGNIFSVVEEGKSSILIGIQDTIITSLHQSILNDFEPIIEKLIEFQNKYPTALTQHV